VVTHLSSAWPHDSIDPSLNAAILSWNAHALTMTEGWWDAPIFWPSPGALALSEHLLGISVLTTPLQWAGATPLTVYNIAFLISFPVTALVVVLGRILVGAGDARDARRPHDGRPDNPPVFAGRTLRAPPSDGRPSRPRLGDR
jgi:hypothetical protein